MRKQLTYLGAAATNYEEAAPFPRFPVQRYMFSELKGAVTSKKLIQLRFAKKVFYYSCPQVVKDAGCCWW
jgi:hypothetical protein